MPKSQHLASTISLDDVPQHSHALFNSLWLAGIRRTTALALCSRLRLHEVMQTEQTLKFLQEEQALTNLNCQALLLVSVAQQPCLAKGLVILKKGRILNQTTRKAIANAHADFVSAELVQLKAAQLLTDDSRQLIQEYAHLASLNSASLIIYLQQGQIPHYIEVAKAIFDRLSTSKLSDLIAALRHLHEKQVLLSDNIIMLVTAAEKAPFTHLFTLANALATLHSAAILTPAIRQLLSQLPITTVWEMCDVILRLKQANCLTPDMELALTIASTTSLIEYGMGTLHQQLITGLTTPFMQRLPDSTPKLLLCALILAVPLEALPLINWLEALEQRQLFTSKTLNVILELGYHQAAKSKGHGENIQKLLNLNLESVQSSKQLLQEIGLIFEDSLNPKPTAYTKHYRQHGLLKPPVITMQAEPQPEPMDIEPAKQGQCRVM